MSNSISNQIEQQYPLHYYIWKNDFKKLKDILSSPLGQKLIEKRDIRGRTPLMLAVTLGHFEISKLLMNLNANVDIDDDHGFNGNYKKFYYYLILILILKFLYLKKISSTRSYFIK